MTREPRFWLVLGSLVQSIVNQCLSCRTRWTFSRKCWSLESLSTRLTTGRNKFGHGLWRTAHGCPNRGASASLGYWTYASSGFRWQLFRGCWPNPWRRCLVRVSSGKFAFAAVDAESRTGIPGYLILIGVDPVANSHH